jgi:hypothetical protein
MLGNQEEHPRTQKNAMEASSIHYEPTISVWGLEEPEEDPEEVEGSSGVEDN